MLRASEPRATLTSSFCAWLMMTLVQPTVSSLDVQPSHFIAFRPRFFSMPRPNFTAVAEFTFEGFSIFGWQHRHILFVVFLVLYLLTLASNAIILTVIHFNRQLHTLMYFFLSALSISETCYTVAIIPRMLSGLLNPQ